MDASVQLELPSVAFGASYVAGLRELVADGYRIDEDLAAIARDLAEHVRLRHAWAEGRELRPGWVAGTEYWITYHGEWAGRLTYRHRLTPQLERIGGHVGYVVRPSLRRRGIASRALGLLVDRLRETAPLKLLITCDAANVASRRVIEHNGGVFADELVTMGSASPIQRYWIEIQADGGAGPGSLARA